MPHFIVAYYAALYYLNIKKDWMDFSLFSMSKYEYMDKVNFKKSFRSYTMSYLVK